MMMRIYVITAKALAQGQGYKLINLPHPLWQTKYPILYPALLAVIWKLWPTFPGNLLIMKWLSVFCGAATVGLSYLYLIRFNDFPRGVALASALLCATSSYLLYFSSQAMSEMPFALLAVSALWMVDAQIERPVGGPSRQFCSGVLSALPFLCRTLGVTLVLAGLLLLYHWKRPLRWVVLGAALVVIPQGLWSLGGLGAWTREPIIGYYTDYLSWWGATGVASIGQVMASNFFDIIWSNTVSSLEGLHRALKSVDLWGWYEACHLFGVIPLIGIASQLRRGQVLPYFLVAYLAVVCLWPWPPMRFIIPILPFIAGYLLLGIWALGRQSSLLPRYRSLAAVGLAILIVANLTLLYRHHTLAQLTGYPYLRLPSKEPVAWSSYQEIFKWLESHAGPADVIASWEDTMIYLYTGRPAFRPIKITPGSNGQEVPSFGTIDDLARTLKAYHTRFLVRVPIHFLGVEEMDKLLDDLEKAYPGWVRPVYLAGDHRFAVLELQPE